MRGRDLRPNARGAVRHHRIEKADHVDAFLEHARREFLRKRGVAQHDRNDRVRAGFDREAALSQGSAKEFGVFFQFVPQFGGAGEQLNRFDGRSHDGRSDGV